MSRSLGLPTVYVEHGHPLRAFAIARRWERLAELLDEAGLGLELVHQGSEALEIDTTRLHELPGVEATFWRQFPGEGALVWQVFSRSADNITTVRFYPDWAVVVELEVSRTEVGVVALAAQPSIVQAVLGVFEGTFGGLQQAAAPERVRLKTCFYTPHGLRSFVASILCPSWEEVRGNYVPAVREALEELCQTHPDPDRGRLLIFHGVPGTGKTYAIRALMRRWRRQENQGGFDFINIVDPDNFLENADYYYEIVQDHRFPCLFILEDSAESLMWEHRAQHGSRIAKLLNLTDGLLAQGREDFFLVTFNEEVRELDAAVLRPGRCYAKIEFQPFSPEEAAEWLRTAGYDGPPPSKACTLAELYALLLKRPVLQAVRKQSIGFEASHIGSTKKMNI
jgi:hypothetical protein